MRVIEKASEACDNEDCDMNNVYSKELRIELDSHANIIVAGRNAAIISDTSRTAEVITFTSHCISVQIIPVSGSNVSYNYDFYSNKFSFF